VPGAALPLALYRERSVSREAALAALNDSELTWEIIYTSPSLTGVRAAALAGLAVTPLPASALIAGLRILGVERGCRLFLTSNFAIYEKARPDKAEAGTTRETMRASFETARLSLSLVRETDRENLVALERDPEVMRFLNGGRPTPDDGAEEGAGFLTPRGGEDDVWAAVETRSGAFVGWFSLRRGREGVGELGYRLRRDAWGRGLASEGAIALVAMAFADNDFRRIVATTMAVNSASRRVMEKTGLIHVRTVYPHWRDPLPGSELGEVEYEITRDEWEAERSDPPQHRTRCV
jgi:RimJ/RimL family protein N-acetyltransferase